MQTQKKVSSTGMIAIMAIFFLALGIGTITPAIQNIAAAFPDIPYTTIMYANTLPTLLLVPATLITGAVAGKKVSYKTLAVIGSGLFIISGVAPAFIHNDFTIILIFRAVFGIALGIITPLGNALIFGSYEGQQRANLLGIGGVVTNFGGVILQMLGGTLSGINWTYCFLAHALGILSFIIILIFLKEPPAAPEPETSSVEKGTEKPKLPMGVWVIAILLGILNILNFPTMMALSTIVVDRGIGDAAAAAAILSLFTVGGMIGGLVFGKTYQITKRYVIAIGMLLMTIGIGLILIGDNLFVIGLGATLLGAGFSFEMPAAMMILGMITPASISAWGISVAMAVMNVGGFISTYWIMAIQNLTGDGIIVPIQIEFVIFVLATIIFFIVDPFPKPKVASTGDDV